MKTKAVIIGAILILIVLGIIFYFSSSSDSQLSQDQQYEDSQTITQPENSFETDEDVFDEIDFVLEGAE